MLNWALRRKGVPGRGTLRQKDKLVRIGSFELGIFMTLYRFFCASGESPAHDYKKEIEVETSPGSWLEIGTLMFLNTLNQANLKGVTAQLCEFRVDSQRYAEMMALNELRNLNPNHSDLKGHIIMVIREAPAKCFLAQVAEVNADNSVRVLRISKLQYEDLAADASFKALELLDWQMTAKAPAVPDAELAADEGVQGAGVGVQQGAGALGGVGEAAAAAVAAAGGAAAPMAPAAPAGAGAVGVQGGGNAGVGVAAAAAPAAGGAAGVHMQGGGVGAVGAGAGVAGDGVAVVAVPGEREQLAIEIQVFETAVATGKRELAAKKNEVRATKRKLDEMTQLLQSKKARLAVLG